MSLKAIFNNLNFPKWLIGILTLVFILRIPSFFEPYYYGDEMIYMSLGQGIRQGLTLYKDIHDNKPPLLYLTAAVSENLFIFKAILCFWNLITIILFSCLASKLFPKNIGVQKISTFLFALLTTLPLFEGMIVNAELFMITFTIAALLILLPNKDQKTNISVKKIYFAGVLFGLGALFKIPAAFDLPIIVGFWLVTTNFRDWGKVILNTVILAIGFSTPLLLSFVWFYTRGALPEYWKAAFLQNFGYLSSFRPGDVQKPFYIRNAPLLIRAFIVILGSLLLFIFRKKVSKNFILFSLWTLLGIFAVTLSERPYPHYFIQVVSPVSFLLGMFFAEKSVEQSLTILPLTIAFIVPFYYKFYYYQTGSYYTRFINFATGSINKTDYFQSFSNNTSRNYRIAEFLVHSSTPQDKVFIWDTDSAIIYALSRRLPPIKFVADYHINDFSGKKMVAGELESTPPKFIILTSGNPYPELTPLIRQKYILISQIGNANIFVRTSFGNLTH